MAEKVRKRGQIYFMRCRVSPFFDRRAEVLGTVIDSGRGEGMVVLALFEEILAQLWRSS